MRAICNECGWQSDKVYTTDELVEEVEDGGGGIDIAGREDAHYVRWSQCPECEEEDTLELTGIDIENLAEAYYDDE